MRSKIIEVILILAVIALVIGVHLMVAAHDKQFQQDILADRKAMYITDIETGWIAGRGGLSWQDTSNNVFAGFTNTIYDKQ